MFTTDAVVQAALADALKLTTDPLPSYAVNIAVRSHARAYNAIARVLGSKGFTAAQVASWDEGVSFETDLAVYFACVQLNTLHTVGVDEKFLTVFDRSKELQALRALMVGGVPQVPGGTYGLPQAGAETTDSIFGTFPDRDLLDSTKSGQDDLRF